jgi:hypothetical protein
VLEVQRCVIGSYDYVASYNQTMATLRLGLDFVGQIHPASSKGHRFQSMSFIDLAYHKH